MIVSAIITTYRRPPEILERAIKSVIAQTFKDIEIIVVDDSPREFELRGLVESMVKSYSKENVVYLKHAKNMGACAARNTGIKYSHGDYIGFLDDDDEWLPEKTERQLMAFTNDNIGMVYCDNNIIYEKKNKKKKYNRGRGSGYLFDKLMLTNFIGSTSFPMIRKTALQEAGGFDELMQSAQDYDMWVRIAKRWRIEYVSEPLVNYYVHANECITQNPIKVFNGIKRFNEKYATYISSHPVVFRIRRTKLAIAYARIGNKKQAYSEFKGIIKEYPLCMISNTKCLIKIIMAKNS